MDKIPEPIAQIIRNIFSAAMSLEKDDHELATLQMMPTVQLVGALNGEQRRACGIMRDENGTYNVLVLLTQAGHELMEERRAHARSGN